MRRATGGLACRVREPVVHESVVGPPTRPDRYRAVAAGERADPVPGPGEIRVRVSMCGVCRTDLHLAEGDLGLHRPRTVPGHEVVGVVDSRGAGATRFGVGQRVGIAWLRHTCGTCRFCRRGDENLCLEPAFTGLGRRRWVRRARGRRPGLRLRAARRFGDAEAAPLLCAGIIGYRALRRAALPPRRPPRHLRFRRRPRTSRRRWPWPKGPRCMC